MRDALSDIRRSGAELVIVGNGRPEHAVDFRDTERIKCPLYVDPELRAYAAAGLKRGLRSSITPGVIVRGIRAFREGKRQGAVEGDPWQQGGVFVIRPGNVVDFAYVSEEAGDHPAPAVVIAALDQVTRPKRPRLRRVTRGSAEE